MKSKYAADSRDVVKLVVSLVLLVAWMAFIFGMSANTGDESQGLSDRVAAMLASVFVPDYNALAPGEQASIVAAMSFPIRKTAHFTEYAILGLLTLSVLWQVRRLVGKSAAVGFAACLVQAAPAMIFAFAYACLDEFHQLFVDGRCGQPFDVGVDTAGAICAIVIACAVLARRSK